MEAIFDNLSQMASSADAKTKRALIAKLHSLADSLDTSSMLTANRLASCIIRDSFASEAPLSVEEIAKSTGGRLLRYLSSHGAIKESGKDEFTCINVTRNLVATGSQAGICHNFETIRPQFQELPGFLRRAKYQDITDSSHTVMQAAFHFEGKAFDWMGEHPENLTYFNDYMAGRRHNVNDMWLSVYPVEAEVKG
ncbi:O-methyl transferase B protein [Rutstroemia sp. NJR-2017a BBW]|nr:O-methyl transferase B protein [Rutstroemia sp. NJR-2017a BBW]